MNIDAQRIITLRQQLTEHSYRYHVTNSPIISDQEYDTLFRELVQLEKEHPEMGDPNSPTMRIGCAVPSGLRKVKHGTKMLSLDKAVTSDEVMRFFTGSIGKELTVEMKIDGLSLHMSYKNGRLVQAVTRGDGTEGEDVTENARTIRTVPLELRQSVDIEVRGEVYWRLSAFNAFNETLRDEEKYSNPRNAASGIMGQKDSREVARCRLDFVAYSATSSLPPSVESHEALLEYLEALGFRSPMTLDVTKDVEGLPYATLPVDREHIDWVIDYLGEYRKVLDMDTDGLVLKLSSIADQREIGESETFPRWALAYKFPPESKETELLDITIQVGKTGQITPVAQLSPINLGGAMVQRASLCNQDELNRLGINIGDIVFVQRSGEVIPKVVGLSQPAAGKLDPKQAYQLPKTCPCCSTLLVRREKMVHSYCPNKECHEQVLAKLTYIVGKNTLDIDGCGEVGVRLMMNKGNVRKLSDLFALTDFSMFKPAQAKKVKEGIEEAKVAPLWRKIAALDIEDIGKQRAQDLAAKYGRLTGLYEGDKLKEAGMYEDVEGLNQMIGPVAAGNLRDWVTTHMDELERLANCGVFFEEDKLTAGLLSGKTFCITGKLVSGGRDEISAMIQSLGGVMKGSVTRKVNYLIRGLEGGAGKSAGAEKWGTQTITEEELYQMVGKPMPILRESGINIDP